MRNRLKKWVTLPAVAVALCLTARAEATTITIGGEEFTKVLEFKTNQDFGFWPGPKKWYGFNGNDNYIKPIDISRTTFADPALQGIRFEDVLAMGTTATTTPGAVDSGSVNLYGRGNELLLSTQYVSGGELSAIYRHGYAGQLEVDGIFEVTGGSLFNSGMLTGPLFIHIAFDYVWQNKVKDLKVKFGTFTFYQGSGVPVTPEDPGTEVPEPMSMGLLLSGLVGAASLRRKSQQ